MHIIIIAVFIHYLHLNTPTWEQTCLVSIVIRYGPLSLDYNLEKKEKNYFFLRVISRKSIHLH